MQVRILLDLVDITLHEVDVLEFTGREHVSGLLVEVLGTNERLMRYDVRLVFELEAKSLHSFLVVTRWPWWFEVACLQVTF